VLADRHKWVAVAVLAAATFAIDLVYLARRRTIPMKFLVPGTIFLIGFQVIPVAYTISVAFTNYSTGHILVKSEAIQGIEQNTLAQADNGKSYTMAPAHDASGKLALVLVDEDTNKTYIGTKNGLKPIPRGSVSITGGLITRAQGYELLRGQALVQSDKELSALVVPVGGNKGIQAEGLDTAVVLEPTFRYDAKRDEFVRLKDNAVYTDNGRGSFVNAKGEDLEPGWHTGVGLRNFGRIIHSDLVRKPFVRVLIWTFAYALLTVLLSFALGLFLAITLDKAGMPLQRLYRSALVIPYAIPGFLSLLVWRGLLNDQFGVVNHILPGGLDRPWLFDANWAKVSIILVSLWLTFPYFFLVSLGALQSIPKELTEAARVDGAGAWQVFRQVTLPLLLVAVAPLMIASFAFNFNNFNNIYLLTGGGPAAGESVAGATDILITYTFKLAFSAGKGADYGLASAVAILIFFIVASISAFGFARSKALENLA
jgi:arabinogalactan oligomer/maltooligosaccharide transport system permease protein